VIGSRAQLNLVPHLPTCEETLTAVVTAFAYEQYDPSLPRWSDGGAVPDPPNDFYARASRPSRPLNIYGPRCPNYAQAQFSLTNLHVEQSSDVDGLEVLCFFCSEDRTQEAYGILLIYLESQDGPPQLLAHIAFWGTPICPGCSMPGEPDDYRPIRNGDYDLAQESLRICELAQWVEPERWDCRDSPAESAIPGFVFYVEEGDSLSATLSLRDDDDGTGDDVWCSGVANTAALTAQGWGDVDRAWSVGNFGADQDAYCFVGIQLFGLGLTDGGS
jgi:hypothetical protein